MAGREIIVRAKDGGEPYDAKAAGLANARTRDIFKQHLG